MKTPIARAILKYGEAIEAIKMNNISLLSECIKDLSQNIEVIVHAVEEIQDEVSRIDGELSQLKDCQIRSIGRQINITNHYWNSCEDWKAAVDYFKTEMKQRAIQVISTIMDLTNVARHQGVIALENEFTEGKSAHSLDNPFLKSGVMLIVDAVDEELISSLLTARLNTISIKDPLYVENTMIMEGLLSVQNGEKPFMTKEKLLSILGEYDSYLEL